MTESLRLHREPELAGAPLVLAFRGWNDAQESASLAIRFLRDAISAEPLAEIDLEDFIDFTVERPLVHTDTDGRRIIEWPKVEFHFGVRSDSRILATGVGCEPHLRWRRFAAHVVELAQRLRVGSVVLLGAYVADVVYSRPVRVTGFASKVELIERIGVPPSAYQGPTGIVGVLADRLQEAGVPVVSLWAGLPQYISVSPNPRGALALVQKLSECLDLKFDTQALERAAAEFARKLSALVASDPELDEYVRQLKRREFAQ